MPSYSGISKANFFDHLSAFLDPNVAVNKDGYLVGANGLFDSGDNGNIRLDNKQIEMFRDYSWNPFTNVESNMFVPSSSDVVGDSYSEDTVNQIYQDILDVTDQQNQAAQSSADRAMEFNAAQADLNRQWQAEQNQKAMDFSERMSNTAYQRAMADMQAAGLNPKLAAQLGGASSPSGVTSSGSTASGSPASMAAANLAPLASVISTYITGADALDRQNNDFVQGILGVLFQYFLYS